MNINPAEIPSSVDYQWVASAVCGDVSLGQVDAMEVTGWRTVPLSRHPKLAKKSISGARIEIGSLVLMERPKLLTERALVWEREKAIQQRAAGHGVEVVRTYTLWERATRVRWAAWVWLRGTRFGQAFRHQIVRAGPTCTLWRWSANSDYLEFTFRPRWRISREELLNTI